MPIQRSQRNDQVDDCDKSACQGRLATADQEPREVEEERSASSLRQATTQTIMGRLNEKLQMEQAGKAADRQQQLLEELGLRLRQWRIQAGYTRQNLADKLDLDVNHLLCSENGIGAPGDITAAQLHTLSSFLGEDELARRLYEAIQQYLPSLDL